MHKEDNRIRQPEPHPPLPQPQPVLVLWADPHVSPVQAEQLAAELHIPLIREEPEEQRLCLRLDANGLALGCSDMAVRHMVRADFSQLLPRIQTQRLPRELLVRAAKMRTARNSPPIAIDASAGLGEDAFLLAAAGFAVELCEHNPIIAALLEDGLHRAKADAALARICSRMQLYRGDSITYLHELQDQQHQSISPAPDLIFLDPMFPARQKSAKVKKKLQLLQMIEQPCMDEEALLQAALAARPKKVVIKRPLKGPNLAGIKPSYVIAGKAVRYDCLLVRTEP